MTATMRYAHPEAIVGTQWLADNLRGPSLRVFDCTTYLRYETGTGRPYRVEGRSAHQIFGSPDDLKFHSSMTLFAAADPEAPVFREALAKYFASTLDAPTVERLRRP